MGGGKGIPGESSISKVQRHERPINNSIGTNQRIQGHHLQDICCKTLSQMVKVLM